MEPNFIQVGKGNLVIIDQKRQIEIKGVFQIPKMSKHGR